MNERCVKCGGEIHPNFLWRVESRAGFEVFCSRRCLVEHLAPELNQAVSVKQWIPTPEDEARMAE